MCLTALAFAAVGCKSKEVTAVPVVMSVTVETIEDAFAEADLLGKVSPSQRERFWRIRDEYYGAIDRLRVAAQLGQPLEQYIREVVLKLGEMKEVL